MACEQRTVTFGQLHNETLMLNETTELEAVLTTLAHQHGLRWLLAHCDDGVIWGELRGDTLALSSQAFPSGSLMLRWNTLQQARLFNESGEILVWRGPNTWQGRLFNEAEGRQVEHFDQRHLLWGTSVSQSINGFVRLREGQTGIEHMPPLDDSGISDTQRAWLNIRHYIAEDEAGVARIVASRLVSLQGANQ